MAKCEELSNSMSPLYKIADDVYPLAFLHFINNNYNNLYCLL